LGIGQVYALVRSRPGASAADRLADRLHRSRDLRLLEENVAIEAVAGDVTLPRFGMSAEDFHRVTSDVDLILHCASELSFIRDESCRETNIAGMRNLINLARECRKAPRVVHISTATICGIVRNRCVAESDGDSLNSEHFNEYTRSKAAAEWVLRESGLPAVIIRPSIVLSNDLPSQDFARAILWFLPMLNEFDAVPIDPVARADVVTVGFVVEAMIKLLQRPELAHDCYHISAGDQYAMRCGQVAEHLDEYFERTRPLKLIPPSEWTREIHRRYVTTPHQRKLFATLKHYLPFLNMDVVYDNVRLERELGNGPLYVPPVREYIGRMLDLVTPRMISAGVLTGAPEPGSAARLPDVNAGAVAS
jgi:thioester reductase-like protein